MTNLLIDGGWFLHRTLFSYKKQNSVSESNPLFSDPLHIEQFMRKLAADLSAIVNGHQGIDRVWFHAESRSWRKNKSQFPSVLEKFKTQWGVQADSTDTIVQMLGSRVQKYKGNREAKREDVKWETFNAIAEEFGEYVKRSPINWIKIQHMEGDDTMMCLSRDLNRESESAIILGTDMDLVQTARVDPNTLAWTAFWNQSDTDPAVYCDSEIKSWAKQARSDSNYSRAQQQYEWLSRTIQKAGVPLRPTHIKPFKFKKMILGDSGDNVSALYTWEKVLQTGKIQTASLTEKRIQPVLESWSAPSDTESVYEWFVANQHGLHADIKTQLALIKGAPEPMSDTEWSAKTGMNCISMMLEPQALPTEVLDAWKTWYTTAPVKWTSPADFPLTRDTFLRDTKYLGETLTPNADVPKYMDPFHFFS
jgi:hypothetical protein